MVSKQDFLKTNNTLTRFCKQVIQFLCRLITCIGFIVFGPAFLLSLVPLIVLKFLVKLVYSLVNPDSSESLSFFDTVFAVDDFYTQPCASTLKCFILEGSVSLKEVKELFCDRVLYKCVTCDNNESNGRKKNKWKFQRLHQKPCRFGWFYFWKEVPIELDLHFNEYNNLVKQDEYLSDSDLCKFLGEMMTNPFPNQSALWEVAVVNNFQGEKSVVILRVHHVIADGYSLNAIVDEMIGKKSPYLVKEQEGLNFKEKLNFLWTAPAWIINFFLEEMFRKNWMSRRKTNTKGVLGITTIPVEAMKSIRRKTNYHFATIGLSLIGGALRRLFLECNLDKAEMPDFVKIMHLLPKPNHPFDRMCNHWSAGSFKVSLKTPNALERLNEAEAFFQEFTQNHFNELLDLQSSIASLIPAPIYNFILSRNYLTNMSFTSLPGFNGPAQLCGRSILDMYKVIGLQYKQTALGAAAYSYNGQLAFSIFANQDIILSQESAQLLTQVHLQAELQELSDLLALNDNQV